MVTLIPSVLNAIGLVFIAFSVALTAFLVIAMLMRQLAPLISEPLRKSFDHIDDIHMPGVE